MSAQFYWRHIRRQWFYQWCNLGIVLSMGSQEMYPLLYFITKKASIVVTFHAHTVSQVIQQNKSGGYRHYWWIIVLVGCESNAFCTPVTSVCLFAHEQVARVAKLINVEDRVSYAALRIARSNHHIWRHDNGVMTWKRLLHFEPFLRGIHRYSHRKGPVIRKLSAMFKLSLKTNLRNESNCK